MSNEREWMLILAEDRIRHDRPLPNRVLQQVSPRVAIVEAVAKEELLKLGGVLAALEPGESAPDDVRAGLTEAEGLFVDAFARRGRLKVRPSDGLSWDAEGFLPPDPPKKR